MSRTPDYRSAVPVICIGNFTVGGAGKTPVALTLCESLREQGYSPGFLTRGYGGRMTGPHLVDISTDNADGVGDEPLLLAAEAPAVVSRKRPAGANLLERIGVDVIIMDDGFQNPSLYKDFSIVVVDGVAGFGSGHVFPLGPLRASVPAQLPHAGAVILLGDKASSPGLVPSLGDVPVFRAEIGVRPGFKVPDGPVIAFCGIGRPAKFFATLRQAGVSVAHEIAFPDHYPFTERDAERLLGLAETGGAALMTTAKDRVRLGGRSGARHTLHETVTPLPIEVVFPGNDGVRLLSIVRDSLRGAGTTVNSFREPVHGEG